MTFPHTFPNHEDWLSPYVPKPGKLALDVGANVGEWTMMLSGIFESVHSFDPNPQVIRPLRERANELPNVTVYEVAVGATCGRALFNLYPQSSQFASLSPDREGSDGIVDVPCLTLDTMGYPDVQVDFIKVDTEGAEDAVLLGAADTLRANHPTMIIEIHSFANLDACRAILDGYGFSPKLVPHPNENAGAGPGHCWLYCP